MLSKPSPQYGEELELRIAPYNPIACPSRPPWFRSLSVTERGLRSRNFLQLEKDAIIKTKSAEAFKVLVRLFIFFKFVCVLKIDIESTGPDPREDRTGISRIYTELPGTVSSVKHSARLVVLAETAKLR